MKSNAIIKITECPRDAMQGIIPFIPTEMKVEYINTLLKVGFDIIDFGSFVSPKANSRIKDTDFAAESAKQAKNNILKAAGTSVLAQANASGQTALKLLG